MGDSNLVLLEQKFDLSNMDDDIRRKFYNALKSYLNHGRTIEFLNRQIDIFIKFAKSISLNDDEIIKIFSSFPGILNSVDELYSKYLFLGIVENDNNDLRIKKLVNKSNDFRVGLKKIYSRYKFMLNVGYDAIGWNTLVHATDQEFASIFVIGKYEKTYRIYNSVSDVLKSLNEMDLSDFDLDKYKELDVNRKIVEGYEGQGFGRRNA